MSKIESITGKIDSNTLIQLGQDKGLKGFSIVLQWDNDEYSVGWSAGLKSSQLALMALLLNSEVTEFARGEQGE